MRFSFPSSLLLRAAPGALLLLFSTVWAGELDMLCADRAAIERVYYQHRLGEKPPFEQTLPPAALDKMVRLDLRKQAVLAKRYGVEITAGMLEAEVQRINATTRAPDILAELKAALGNDPRRFARTVAQPILVERRLREKFDNDDALHAPQRRAMETLRRQLLTASDARGGLAATNSLVNIRLTLLRQAYSNAVTETIWQLGERPAETNGWAVDEIEIKRHFGPHAQMLSSPPPDELERKFYFEELPHDLQNVLRVQLRQAGDVSAVIETSDKFLLYVAQERTETVLSVAAVSLPKRNYEQWLEE